MPASDKRSWIENAARLFALAAGSLLCLMAALVVSSIVGRVVFGRPVAGDFEIVAMITAVSIFLCLPYCHLNRGNVVVDLFFSGGQRRLRRGLDVFAAAIYGLIALAFAWRMAAGFLDAVHYRDMSAIVGLPLWWAYPPAVASFALLAACCVTTALDDLKGDPE